jgi:ParB family transcriptional regulator, chromosome partitioning protein
VGIGLVELVVVVPVQDGYRMVTGYRRCTGTILAELPTVPCFVRPDLADSDPDQVAAMIDASVHRQEPDQRRRGPRLRQLEACPPSSGVPRRYPGAGAAHL